MRLPFVQSLFGFAAGGAIILLPTGAAGPTRPTAPAPLIASPQSGSSPIVLTPAIKAALNPGTIGPFPAEKPKTALEALTNNLAHAIFPPSAPKQGPELAYAPEAASPLPNPGGTTTDAPQTDLPKPAEVLFPPHPDAPAIREALDAYRKNDFVRGDAAARNATDPLVRTALEWAALRLQPRPAGFARLIAFADQHPQWPSDSFMRGRAEDALYGDKNLAQARAYFARHTPVSASGRLAKARLLLADKHTKEAAALVAQVWRNEDIGTWTETALKKEFGDLLTAQDHRFRSDRLFYKEKLPASLRAAAFVSPDYVALAKARNAVANEQASDKLMEAVPKSMRTDPTYLFARIQILRRAGKIQEAAAAMMTAPDSAEALVSGDDWWTERRLIARKLLDAGDATTAWRIAAGQRATSNEARIEAEFHVGWIALQFLNDPTTALGHFAAALEIAQTPISRARAAYWQARAAERGEEPEDAGRLYAIAAEQSSTYYGQLARARLGLPDAPLRQATTVASGDDRDDAIRAVEAFLSVGEKDLAFRLTVDLARTLEDKSQIAALAAITARSRDARATLLLGKLTSQRGVALDDVAFPIFGVPDFTPLARSVALPVVYSIARQESAFQGDVVSHAGAKGLMQMLTSTARRTAQRAGVPFDEKRLLSDTAFNAQLGAAHLADLMDEQGQSLILTFAAYNAGGKRVKEWIAAYGDPRKPGVDPIDWVERIPFTETRNYVQRVAENLGIYRARLSAGDTAPQLVVKDLRAREARL